MFEKTSRLTTKVGMRKRDFVDAYIFPREPAWHPCLV
jgi:hypothetical protein